jgi:error-prone DNA polymerase
MRVPYAELHCVSNFSFLRGASHPEELVDRALALDYAGLAVTDECSFAGSVRAHLELKEQRESDELAREFKLIHGTEIQLVEGEGKKTSPGAKLVLLAQTRAGYGNLSQLVTLARRQAVKGSYRLSRADIESNAQWLDDVLALLVPLRTWREPLDEGRITNEARWLAELKPDAGWIACELTRGADDAAQLAALQAIGDDTGLPLVAAGDVHMHARRRKKLADVLTAVRVKTPLAQCGRLLPPNAERYLRPLYRLARIYPTELLLQTQAIAERCTFSLDELRYEYPEEIVPPGETPASWLRRATYEEARKRYPQGMPARVKSIVDHELALIEELRYEPYFLTVYDIVRFARSQNILCQGRGSAANSAVCYCLGITEVDPARMSVLFERFISKERNEPPDIDVDFEHQRREEVMQYVYAKYGRHRAALTAALHTYRPKGALRDIGKALGLSLDQVDKLAKTMAWWDGRRIIPQRLEEAGFDPDNPVITELASLAQEVIGFPRHLSQHSGGFVIARDRLDRMVPIENAAMDDRTVIQWDKDDLDALGLLKIDVLALGMLSCVRRALDHITRRKKSGSDPDFLKTGSDPDFRLQDIPAEDPAVYDMLCRGDSLGVFQVESRAQMNMLPRLAPRCFYDLVIETAIVRPGPIQGGMVHPYLRRRQNLEPVTYPSEAVKAVLERTLGVSIFQEQVMQLAVVAAGFTPGEADKLRRAMAAWRRKGGIGPFRDKLIRGMLARGYTPEYAEQIYKQIQGFGEYGFPESHAASFGLLVYVSSWIKCHEPAAFCAALLDSQPLGFYAPAQIVRDAMTHGVEVRPIDVTISDWNCALEPSTADRTKPAVRLGLELVASLPEAAGLRIMAARSNASFTDVRDLARRAQLSRGELNALAKADALAALTGHRRRALWATLGVDGDAPRTAPLAAVTGAEASVDLLAPTEGQEIVADYHHTALTLRRHPLALLRERLNARGIMTAADISNARNQQRVRTTGIVTCRQRPGTASGVTFVTIEDETGTVNVVVWNSTGETYRRTLLGAMLMTVYGHVERVTTGVTPIVHLIAARLEDHSTLLGDLTVASRDFH